MRGATLGTRRVRRIWSTPWLARCRRRCSPTRRRRRYGLPGSPRCRPQNCPWSGQSPAGPTPGRGRRSHHPRNGPSPPQPGSGEMRQCYCPNGATGRRPRLQSCLPPTTPPPSEARSRRRIPSRGWLDCADSLRLLHRLVSTTISSRCRNSAERHQSSWNRAPAPGGRCRYQTPIRRGTAAHRSGCRIRCPTTHFGPARSTTRWRRTAPHPSGRGRSTRCRSMALPIAWGCRQ
ncbi:hypothetical protein MYSI104531_26385 [Mycobacterium simiae]